MFILSSQTLMNCYLHSAVEELRLKEVTWLAQILGTIGVEREFEHGLTVRPTFCDLFASLPSLGLKWTQADRPLECSLAVSWGDKEEGEEPLLSKTWRARQFCPLVHQKNIQTFPFVSP